MVFEMVIIGALEEKQNVSPLWQDGHRFHRSHGDRLNIIWDCIGHCVATNTENDQRVRIQRRLYRIRWLQHPSKASRRAEN